MSDIIKAVHQAVWSEFRLGNAGYVMPNLIIMSRDSAREIMRSQGHADIHYARDQHEPDRIYGVRIAYDDSLQLGEFIPAIMRAGK
jgi:hypothetical protein